MQELQTQWEVALCLIYDTAMDLLKHHCPSVHLQVVGDEEMDPSTQQTSAYEQDAPALVGS